MNGIDTFLIFSKIVDWIGRIEDMWVTKKRLLIGAIRAFLLFKSNIFSVGFGFIAVFGWLLIIIYWFEKTINLLR